MKDKIKEDFAFYDEYHRHPINKLIHIVCIPGICWSLFVFLNNIDYNIPLITNSSQEISPWISECTISLKPSFILYLGYIIYYLYLVPCLGSISALFYLIILYSSNLFVCNIDESWEIAGIVFVASWILQILGHKCIEGNSPAFLKGFVQSFLTAPLFIVLEICNIICCGSKCIKIEKPIKPLLDESETPLNLQSYLRDNDYNPHNGTL